MATKKISYKEAITEIEDILEKIENDELDVDELSEKVKQVSSLIKICKEKLQKTEEEVEKNFGRNGRVAPAANSQQQLDCTSNTRHKKNLQFQAEGFCFMICL